MSELIWLATDRDSTSVISDEKVLAGYREAGCVIEGPFVLVEDLINTLRCHAGDEKCPWQVAANFIEHKFRSKP